MKNILSIVTFGLTFIMLSGMAQSATLWEQGEGASSGTISCDHYNRWHADDFQLSTTSSITDVSWIGGRNSGDTPPAPDGFWIRFFNNYYDSGFGANRPSDDYIVELYFSAGNVSRSATPAHDQYYTYSANLSSPFVANSSDVYWISIQADTNSSDAWYGWNAANTTNLNESVSLASGTYYDGTYHDHAFSLAGEPVPIPSALWLLGSSFIGLLGFRRKFSKGL